MLRLRRTGSSDPARPQDGLSDPNSTVPTCMMRFTAGERRFQPRDDAIVRLQTMHASNRSTGRNRLYDNELGWAGRVLWGGASPMCITLGVLAA